MMITRMRMTYSLRSQRCLPSMELRPPTTNDRDQLASLLLESYRDSIDQEFETYLPALAEIERLFQGEHGLYLPQHSRIVEHKGQLISAALITYWHERPLLAYAMTFPTFRQQGLGGLCIQHAMQSLVEADYTSLNLVVTVGNEAAFRLYKKLGFVESH